MIRRLHTGEQLPNAEGFIGSGIPGDNWVPLCRSMAVTDALLTPEGRVIPYIACKPMPGPSWVICEPCQRLAWDRWKGQRLDAVIDAVDSVERVHMMDPTNGSPRCGAGHWRGENMRREPNWSDVDCPGCIAKGTPSPDHVKQHLVMFQGERCPAGRPGDVTLVIGKTYTGPSPGADLPYCEVCRERNDPNWRDRGSAVTTPLTAPGGTGQPSNLDE